MEERDHTIEVDICHLLRLEAVSAKMLITVSLNKTKNDQYVSPCTVNNHGHFLSNVFFRKHYLTCFVDWFVFKHYLQDDI